MEKSGNNESDNLTTASYYYSLSKKEKEDERINDSFLEMCP